MTEGTALGILKERTCVPFVTLSIHETITNEEVYRTRFKASGSKTNNPKWGISHKMYAECVRCSVSDKVRSMWCARSGVLDVVCSWCATKRVSWTSFSHVPNFAVVMRVVLLCVEH